MCTVQVDYSSTSVNVYAFPDHEVFPTFPVKQTGRMSSALCARVQFTYAAILSPTLRLANVPSFDGDGSYDLTGAHGPRADISLSHSRASSLILHPQEIVPNGCFCFMQVSSGRLRRRDSVYHRPPTWRYGPRCNVDDGRWASCSPGPRVWWLGGSFYPTTTTPTRARDLDYILV